MFKKIIQKLVILTIITTQFLLINTAFAEVNTNILLAPPKNSEKIISGGSEQIDAFENLPDVGLEGAVATAIKTILGWSFILSIIALVIAGIYMIIYEAEDEKITKAKSIIVYLIFGVMIISIAYGIVTGMVQMKYFK